MPVPVRLNGFGEKEAVTPFGKPATEKLMGAANVVTELTGTHKTVEVPRPNVTLPGL